MGEAHDFAKCWGVGGLVVPGLVQGIVCEFEISSGGDMSTTSPEIAKSRSVEQSATNNKLCVLDGETVALKYKVRLHFDGWGHNHSVWRVWNNSSESLQWPMDV